MEKMNKAIFDVNSQSCNIMNDLINEKTMEKINIAELLKDCPRGMELDCTMYENVYFNQIYDDDGCLYKIGCYTIVDGIRTSINFTKFGEFNTHKNSKCVIFPKGKTTWEGFVPPYQFKDGDIVTYKYENGLVSMILSRFVNFVEVHHHCALYDNAKGFITNNYIVGEPKYIRLASEEEKRELFEAIKANGYKWNEETKTLENLIEPKFNVGDRVRPKNTPSFIVTINDIDESSYYYGNSNSFWILDQNKWELVPMMTPKFKIGDRIKNIKTGQIHKVTDIYGCNEYISFQVDYSGYEISYKFQDEYELVPNKFDINTLVPFESKVLARDGVKEKWYPAIWGYYDSDCQNYPYKLIGDIARCCIPYEGNEHLLGKTDNCDDYFKTWK